MRQETFYRWWFLIETVGLPALFALWWYRRELLRAFLASLDTVGLLGIKLYRRWLAR